MNIKKENQLKLCSLIKHRIDIIKRSYPPEYEATRENSLKILDGLIYERVMELRSAE